MAPRRIVLASSNSGKLAEFRALLANTDIALTAQSQLSVPEAAETGLSFVENAIIKARHAAHHTGLPALADDSGLEVDALDGAPGIYSARFAGGHGDDAANNRKLLSLMKTVPEGKRTARFQCVLVYLRHAEDPVPLICQGTWEGRIARQPGGAGGFGYDPLFYVPDRGCTAAELPADTKNRFSHRARAMTALAASLPPHLC